jgi:hypothetical protein
VSEIRSFWRNAMTFEVGVAEMPLRLRSSSYVLSGGRLLLNTDLIDGARLRFRSIRQACFHR